jgi:hypothetical protein
MSLIKNANAGDIHSARDAYDYCTAYLKLDESSLPSVYLGKCGGAAAILLNAAIESGDPIDARDTILDIDSLARGRGAPIPSFYKEAAALEVGRRCSGATQPPSCSDADAMKFFGLKPKPNS